MSKNENDADKVFEELKKYFMNEFSKTFSDKVVSLAYEPLNVGSLENPDGHARISGSCGDTMEIYIDAEGKKIEKITFLTDGCGATLACGSAVTELAKGKTIREAEKIDVLHVLEYLDDLPPSHEHCAVLAVKTLRHALKDLK
jgi:nitrogen fixation NifU-like protein